MLVIKTFEAGITISNNITGMWMADGNNRMRPAKDITRYRSQLEAFLADPAWVKINDSKDSASPIFTRHAYLAIVWEPDFNELGEMAP